MFAEDERRDAGEAGMQARSALATGVITSLNTGSSLGRARKRALRSLITGVPSVGLEPTRLATTDFESAASANSATRAGA